MARINLSTLFETSRALATEAGGELKDFIIYFADFSRQIIQALKNGLSFEDNFNAKVVNVSLINDTAQIINTDGNTPVGVIPIRVVSTTVGLDDFSWYFDDDGNFTVKAGFTGSPSDTITVRLVILY